MGTSSWATPLRPTSSTWPPLRSSFFFIVLTRTDSQDFLWPENWMIGWSFKFSFSHYSLLLVAGWFTDFEVWISFYCLIFQHYVGPYILYISIILNHLMGLYISSSFDIRCTDSFEEETYRDWIWLQIAGIVAIQQLFSKQDFSSPSVKVFKKQMLIISIYYYLSCFMLPFCCTFVRFFSR